MDRRTSLMAPVEVNNLELAVAAQKRLATYSYLGLRDICCEELEDGVISIRGRVSSYYCKQLAQEIVRRIQGVRCIYNQLTVLQLDIPKSKHKN